jgi:hypothetical protein
MRPPTIIAALAAIVALSSRGNDVVDRLSDQTGKMLPSYVATSLKPVPVKDSQVVHFSGGISGGHFIEGRSILQPIPIPKPVRPADLLPVDLLPILDDAYLHCTAIRIAKVALDADLRAFPNGYFKSDNARGYFIAEKIEVVDERSLKKIFAQIAEGIDGFEDEMFLYSLNGDGSLAHYKKEVCFAPDYIADFLGERRLTIEIDLKSRRAVFESADGRWGSCEFDSIETASLRGLFEGQFKVPNQLPDPTSPSVTPPAGAGGAPSVAADH